MAVSSLVKCPVIFMLLIASSLLNVGLTEEPTFTQCRVHIEAAIKGVGLDDQPESSSLLEEHPVEEQLTEPIVDYVEEHYEMPPEEPAVEEPVPEIIDEEHDDDEDAEQDEKEETNDSDDNSDDGQMEDDDNELAEEEESHPEEALLVAEPEPMYEEEVVEEQILEEHISEEIPEPEAQVQEEPILEEPLPEEPIPESEPILEADPVPMIVVEEPVPTPQPEPVVVTEEPIPVVEPEVVTIIKPEVIPVGEPEAAAAPVQEAIAPVEEEVAVPIQAAPVVIDDPAEGFIEEAPEVKRSRDHIAEILRLGEEPENKMMRDGIVLNVLKDVKKLVENSVRSLEDIFKYNDVSNRNFGDSEIFSKPLVLFLGPWSGGKSSIVNYLLGTEYTQNALKTGAEPSATFFQILMHGETEEMLDGTQLAADWTFSGLQKFGQAFIDRLRGKRLPNKLLEKANIVEVPGILEVRKQVDRPYPFNDVVQWFIDRADIIFVVYDPTKLDTGLEHEALFDQLKGRQNQVRVLLNKADSVTQEELLLIQNNLVWNLSPLMASSLPPTLYAGSFWSKAYKPDAPVRLLRSHENHMLQDLRDTLDNVVENTIAEARRHAVRVRNHAKMVDCYLTTFLNQKGFFGNKKAVADDIIENPHNYHIFEGLSTLSNISRYDLPDAEVYKDFFRLHPLYDFKPLASTCTFFRGCPLDKLDTAIAYELPELVGKYKKRLQSIASKKPGH